MLAVLFYFLDFQRFQKKVFLGAPLVKLVPAALCAMADLFLVQVGPPKKIYTAAALQLKPVFCISGKSQTMGDFTASRLSQILPTTENSKSYISPIVSDGPRQIWRIGSVSIFPTCPTFV